VRLRRALEPGAAALVAAALVGGVPHARAHDPASGAAVHVTADPPQLVLGRDAGAELRIAAPEDAEDVAVSANAGRVEDVKRLPAGGWAARWIAPATRVPLVAIVGAVARTPRGAVDGWIAIPCSGQADARVRAAPGAEIELAVAGRRFGPRTAGSDGLAVIPIVVPPGVREAHHGFKPIDLKVPETPLLHAALDRAAVHADRTERVRVFAWVVAPHGAARRGDAPALEATRGTVATVERRPGEFEATWTLPPGRAGEERVVVRLASSPASRTVLRLDALAGPPAVVAVSLDRAGVVAGAEDGAAVTVRALDAGGNPVAAALALEADGAELSDVRQPEPGVLLARLRAPASLHGRTGAVLRASAPSAGISGTRTLPLLPGPPARVRLDAPPGAVRSGTTAVLAASVSDAGGNPVASEPALSVDRGKVVRVEGAAPGVWRVTWAAPPVDAPSRARIAATLGPLRATAEPVLLPPRPGMVLSASAGGASDLRGRFAGARGGAALDLPAVPDRALPLGVELAWRLELEAASLGDGPGVAILAGGSAARVLGPKVVMRASATGGALAAGGTVAPAGRLALDAGLERRGIAPFVEVALLGATEGAPGAFAAMTASIGIRSGVERR
jgi:hypothetical protein